VKRLLKMFFRRHETPPDSGLRVNRGREEGAAAIGRLPVNLNSQVCLFETPVFPTFPDNDAGFPAGERSVPFKPVQVGK